MKIIKLPKGYIQSKSGVKEWSSDQHDPKKFNGIDIKSLYINPEYTENAPIIIIKYFADMKLLKSFEFVSLTS